MLCQLCSRTLGAQQGRGRPRRWCSERCRTRAKRLRRRTRETFAYADRLDELADEVREGRVTGFGNEGCVREQGSRVRAYAQELANELGAAGLSARRPTTRRRAQALE